MQRVLNAVFPPTCLICHASVSTPKSLCGECRGKIMFLSEPVCDLCSVPLLGPARLLAQSHICDTCLRTARPWSWGRSVFAYRDAGKRAVLAMKHGDRIDLASTFGIWMADRVKERLARNTLVLPVPMHRRRFLSRRFNPAAELGRHLANHLNLAFEPKLLVRARYTKAMQGMTKAERFAVQQDAIEVDPKLRFKIAGRSILVVDDVLTSGATLAAATEALMNSGAKEVGVCTLARAYKDDYLPPRSTNGAVS